MPDILVAQGNSLSEFQNATPAIDQLVEGQRGRVEVTFPGGGLAGDLAGAEQIWGNAFAPVGAVVLDVEGTGLNTMIVHFVVPVTQAQQGMATQQLIQVILLIGAIAGVIAAAGWAISKAALLVNGDDGGGGLAGLTDNIVIIVLIVIAVLVLKPDLLGSKKR